MTHLEIVEKLIGNITPVGETNTDNQRFENLKELCSLTLALVQKIDVMGDTYKDSYEFSVKRASTYAREFIDEVLRIAD